MKNNDNLLRISALTVPTDVNKGSMCPSLSLNGFLKILREMPF
jgi:hypothetical protein